MAHYLIHAALIISELNLWFIHEKSENVYYVQYFSLLCSIYRGRNHILLRSPLPQDSGFAIVYIIFILEKWFIQLQRINF